jgi:ribosomal protein L32
VKNKLISAEALMQAVRDDIGINGKNFAMVQRHIDDAPAVDAVEVVRCKDCKHFIQAEHGCNHFGYYSHTPWVDEVDFCSYGERREGE